MHRLALFAAAVLPVSSAFPPPSVPQVEIGRLPRQRRPISPIDLPDPPTSAPASAPAKGAARVRAAPPPADWAAGNDRADLVLRECMRSRDPESPLAREARAALVAMGEEARGALEAALASKHPAVLAVAAQVLGASGDREAWASILRALEGRPPREAVRPLVDALLRLDPAGAIPALIGELAHPSGAVRAEAASALGGKLRRDHVPLLLDAARRAPSDGKERAVHLLAPFEEREVFEFFLQGFEDPAASTARACADALARARSEEPLALLNATVERGLFGRDWGYACLSLAMREEATLEPAFAAGLEPACLSALASPDPFVSGAAAVALATIGFRSEEASASGYLDGPVPQALVASIAGSRFYRDFASLSEIAARRLALLAGEGEPRSGPQWAAWWVRKREGFHAQRAALFLPEGEEANLVLSYERAGPLRGEGAGEAPLRAVFRCEALVEEGAAGEEFLLGKEEAVELGRFARASGLLEARVLPGIRGRVGDGFGKVVFRLGDRRKEVGRSAGAPDPAFAALEERLRDLVRANLWQRYFDPDAFPSRAEFLAANRAFFSAPHDPVGIAARGKNLVLGALDDLRGDARVRAIEDLAALPGIEAIFGEGDAAVLLSNLSSGPSPSEFDRLAVRFVARVRGPGSLGKIADAVASRFGDRGLSLLASTLAEAGVEAVREALASPLPLVRAAAAEVAAARSDAGAAAGILALLDAPEEEVRAAGARALGRLGLASAVGRLAAASSSDTSEAVRRASLLSLGRLGGAEAVSALERALGDPSAAIRSGAIEGLAESGDARAAGILSAVFARGRANAEVARRGLLLMGKPARAALAPHLTAEDPGVRRTVRFLLAELGDPRAFPGLLDDLGVEPANARAADALALLTGVDFAETPDAVERWRAWWERNRGLDDRLWFLEGLGREGIEIPLGLDGLREDGDRSALASLATVVEKASWPLAARAAAWARVISGRDLGEVERGTTPADRASLGARIRQASSVR